MVTISTISRLVLHTGTG